MSYPLCSRGAPTGDQVWGKGLQPPQFLTTRPASEQQLAPRLESDPWHRAGHHDSSGFIAGLGVARGEASPHWTPDLKLGGRDTQTVLEAVEMVSEGPCSLGRAGPSPPSDSLSLPLSLLQAKFLSQDQINGRLGLLVNGQMALKYGID